MPILRQVSIESKISKQFIYNWLQLAKILSKFYKKKLKAEEGDATIISFLLALGRFWHVNFQTQKFSINEHE